jgi:hypothetical protein
MTNVTDAWEVRQLQSAIDRLAECHAAIYKIATSVDVGEIRTRAVLALPIVEAAGKILSGTITNPADIPTVSPRQVTEIIDGTSSLEGA